MKQQDFFAPDNQVSNIQMKSEPPAKSGRIHAMDSLRGLASLQVLLHHAFGMSILFLGVIGNSNTLHSSFWVNLITFSPLHILWAGHEAVIFFFVMSGFVLSIPYYRNKGGVYTSFFIKRMFRIYVPYLITIIIGLTLNSFLIGHDKMQNLSIWVNGIFTKEFTSNEIFNFIFFLKGDFSKLVTSLWSLPVEIKISFILPFILIPIKKMNIPFTLALPVLNMIFYHVGKKLGWQDGWNDFALFYYFTFFLFGAALSKYQHLVVPLFNRFNNKAIVALILITIVLYTYTWNIVWLPNPIFVLLRKIPSDYIASIAALLLIIISATNKVGTVLSHKYLEELGKISFSLYLIHPIIMAVVAIFLGNILSPFVIIVMSILMSLLLSFPFHYWIEWPLQKLGRRLGDKSSQ